VKDCFFFQFKDLIKYGNTNIVKQTPHEANNTGVKIPYYNLNMCISVMVVLPAILTLHSARD